MFSLLLFALIRIGLENSISNTSVFIYNADTVFATTQRSVFVSFYKDLNFFNVALGKQYFGLQYNYEKGVFTSYGSIIKDTTVNYTSFFASLKNNTGMFEWFLEREGKYDTLTEGGNYIGFAYHLDWPKHGIMFQHTIKYGINSGEPATSFSLSINAYPFDLLLLGSFTENSRIGVLRGSFSKNLLGYIEWENDMDIFYKTIRIQSLLGLKEIKIGGFLERDINEGYIMPGIAVSTLTTTKNVCVMLLSNTGYKQFKDTFFNSNTPHFDLSGNFSFNLYGFTLGITGTVIYECENKSFYITSYMSKDF